MGMVDMGTCELEKMCAQEGLQQAPTREGQEAAWGEGRGTTFGQNRRRVALFIKCRWGAECARHNRGPYRAWRMGGARAS